MRKLLLLVGLLAALGTATPALAADVTVTNDSGCRHAYVGTKEVTPSNGVCYLGPPPF